MWRRMQYTGSEWIDRWEDRNDAVGHLRRFIWIIPIVWKAPALRVFYALRAIVFTTAERKHAR